MRRWGGGTFDVSTHKMVSQIQKIALYKVFNPTILQRIQDNEIRMGENQNKFTLNEMFGTLSTVIWKELENNGNVNSFRRNLQKEHLEILVYIMLDKNNQFPNDAVAFSRENLHKLSAKLHFSINNDSLNEHTISHYLECLNKIESSHQAHTILN